MADPNATDPGPNTPRNVGLRIWAWSQTNQVAAGTICGLLVGFVLGKLV